MKCVSVSTWGAKLFASGRADATVHKRMSSPLGANLGVCVCVRVCACVPASLPVRECVFGTSLFMPGVSLRMKAVDVKDFGLIHCDNVIRRFAKLHWNLLSGCSCIVRNLLLFLHLCLVCFPPERHVLIFGC